MILFALALAVAPAPYDDGAQGCLAYGVFTEVVANGGNLTFEVPAPPDGFEVTAVVLGDESDPVQHEIVAPVSPGQIVAAGYYIDHVHICYAQAQPPEESWPATTSTVSPAPTCPSSVSPVTSPTTMAPVPTTPVTSPTSTSSPTPSLSLTTMPSPSSSIASSVAAEPTLPVTGVGSGLVAVWASCLIALGVALVGVTRRRT